MSDSFTSEVLAEADFMRRLRARFVERAGEGADDAADAVDFEQWSEGWENDPEGAADEEMSYWENDGE